MSDFLNYPAPSSYKDWQSWAAMLVQQLQNASQAGALSIPLYVADATKLEVDILLQRKLI